MTPDRDAAVAVYKRPGSPFFQVEFVFQGKRIRESSGTSNETVAKAFERKLRGELYDQVKLGRTVTPEMTIRQAVERYIETHLRHKVRLAKSAKTDIYLLDNMIELLGGDHVLISTLTTKFIADWKDNVLVKGRESATVNRYLATLKAILRQAHRHWGMLAVLPLIQLLPLRNARTRWLTVEEEDRLLEVCKAQPHLWNFVVVLLDTGARLSEAANLTWDNVHLDGARGNFIVFARTKGDKIRSVPITNRVMDVLKILKEMCPVGEQRVFLRRLPGCIWRKTKPSIKPFHHVHGAWMTAIAKAKLPGVRIHDLRHTYASRLVQNGVPLLTVSKLLGHASLAMTMRYAHLAQENFETTVLTLNSIKRSKAS